MTNEEFKNEFSKLDSNLTKEEQEKLIDDVLLKQVYSQETARMVKNHDYKNCSNILNLIKEYRKDHNGFAILDTESYKAMYPDAK